MRLLSARIRNYRLHRDLSLQFAPRFTLIAGANQSGKSTLVEALHRALFLPARSGGDLLRGMQTDPFVADPEVELVFDCGDGPWTLLKRFAAGRGSVSLQDAQGRSLNGDAAEERLAALVGSAAVARNRGAAEQLRERWGHLWIWQGSSSHNPLQLSATASDRNRLLEQLQASAELTVESALDQAVREAIGARWSAIYTAGGANRAPQPRAGSALFRIGKVVSEADAALLATQEQRARQEEDQQQHAIARDTLARLAQQLPARQQQHQQLERTRLRCRELQSQIEQQQPRRDGLHRELQQRRQDQQELTTQQQRLQRLEGEQAPRRQALQQLQQALPPLEQQRLEQRRLLEASQAESQRCSQAAEALEQRQDRGRLLLEQRQLQGRLAAAEQLQRRLEQLDRDLAALPAIDAGAVEQLRQLERTLQSSQVTVETLAAGIEVIRAGQPLRLDGESLAVGAQRRLVEPTRLQVGNDVELLLRPGGGSGVRDARQRLQAAEQALARALAGCSQPSVEAAATAERRRSDLLAERERLLEQRGADAIDSLRRRSLTVAEQLEALPPGSALRAEQAQAATAEALEAALQKLELQLQQARQQRQQALQAEQHQRQQLDSGDAALEDLRRRIQAAEAALQELDRQQLEARTRINAVLERCGSAEALQAALTSLEQQLGAAEAGLQQLQRERDSLDPAGLESQVQALEQDILKLQEQQQQAEETRIRCSSRLQGDGQLDLQAELEQRQAELEAALQEQERLQREAAMLDLLKRLLEEEHSAMASRYTAPLIERISAYLGQVFDPAPQPQLHYEARDGFQELRWRRDGEASFRFEVLSTGAREQFAGALRLAMAEVLAEAYDGCLPLVFDDAFANADPEALQGVQRMLAAAAARGLQVILLTCDLERSEAIAAAMTSEPSAAADIGRIVLSSGR